MQTDYRHELDDRPYQEPVQPIGWLLLAGIGIVLGVGSGAVMGWW